MTRPLNVAVALAIVLALLGYMLTFTVRFNETAILTTFGRVGEGGVVNPPQPDGRPGDEAGIRFKAPWPIQQVVRTYDTRVQVLETNLEQAATADGQTVAVRLYVAWRISDPLAFYKRLGSVPEAIRTIQSRTRDSFSVVGRYRFDQLSNSDPRELRLAEAEAAIQDRVQARLDEGGYGVRVEEVAIKRILLPASVSGAVVARMVSERERLAAEAQVEGETAAQTLRDESQRTAGIIDSFARTQASQIEAVGRQRAAEFVTRFAADPEFAIFLARLDAIRQAFGRRTRFILGADFPLLQALDGESGGGGSGPTTRPMADVD